MIRRSFLVLMMIIVLSATGCIKETYDMNSLSKKAQLSPTIAISAIKGDISLNDVEIFKSSENVVIDEDNFVRIVFREDSILDLGLTDFEGVKGVSGNIGSANAHLNLNNNVEYATTSSLLIATFEPYTLNLDYGDIISHISGDFLFANPSIKFNYANSFADPIQLQLNASGNRNNKSIGLNLAPFDLVSPTAPSYSEVSSSFIIDKTNSTLDSLISMPPIEITFSGTATMTVPVKASQAGNNLVSTNKLIGSLELEVPLDLKINNLSFNDTISNFLKEDNNGISLKETLNPENFEFLRVDIRAKNGFPLGVTAKMSLYDSNNQVINSTVEATSPIEPALADSNGKATEAVETSTTIEFTREFFSLISSSDKIIFQFTLNTSEQGTKNVKIYSDYMIDFNAALVVKPNFKLK